MDEGLDRPWRGDAEGVLDSSSLSAPGTRSLAEKQSNSKVLNKYPQFKHEPNLS